MTFLRETISEIIKSRFIDGNRVKILYKGRDYFETIFGNIEMARKIICLQFYIFRNDETGKELAEILKRKAKEGVRIYILYDHFGSFGTPSRFWDSLRSEGINIRASRPFKWRRILDYPHRDHRKLIIIDRNKVFTGGLNIANEYRGFHIRLKKEGWRDTGIMIEGPAADELFRIFERTWRLWGGDKIEMDGPVEGFENGLPVIPIFASSARGRRRMRKLFYYSINNARKSIFLTTAYFTPSRRMIDSLEEAVRRGVDVRILLPGKSDVPAAHYAGRAFFTRLLKRGIRIYNYQGEVLHAKSYVFDRCWSIVGSANLDFQSLRWNDEGNVGILNEGFGSKMIEIFEEDLKRSKEIRIEDWLIRPWSEKLKERFFVLFRRRL